MVSQPVTPKATRGVVRYNSLTHHRPLDTSDTVDG
jgi:hypothetical protein